MAQTSRKVIARVYILGYQGGGEGVLRRLSMILATVSIGID